MKQGGDFAGVEAVACGLPRGAHVPNLRGPATDHYAWNGSYGHRSAHSLRHLSQAAPCAYPGNEEIGLRAPSNFWHPAPLPKRRADGGIAPGPSHRCVTQKATTNGDHRIELED